MQSAGIPLTEVGTLALDGAPASPADRPAPGAALHAGAVRRPEALPAGGLLLDVHLGSLARRLRLLGLDAAWSPLADDPDLVTRARAEDRVLLTADRGLLMRRALPAGAWVRGATPDEQLADVLDRFRPPLAPLTRCPVCNGELTAVDAAAVAERLEPGTRRTATDFSRCRRCGRVYWRGAHARRIDVLVEHARRLTAG